MAIESLQALVTASENRDICDVIIESDCVDRGVTQAESLEKMRGLYAAIRRAQRGYDPKLRSASGMVGGDGEKMRAYVQRGKTICGDYIGGVIAQALEMGADAVLVNTAIAVADDPVMMARAFRMAVEAGLLARGSGPGSRSFQAQATSPLTGFLEAIS